MDLTLNGSPGIGIVFHKNCPTTIRVVIIRIYAFLIFINLTIRVNTTGVLA